MVDIKDYDVQRVSTEYKVNKDKRTVVCIIKTYNDVAERLRKYGLADEDYDDIDLDIRTYKGIARCAPGDEWDEVYGRRLAEYRAARARQLDVNADLNKYIKGVTECVNNLCNFGFMKTPHDPRTRNEEIVYVKIHDPHLQ